MSDPKAQLANALTCLIVNPDEMHKNLQRTVFALAFWFDAPLPRVRAFLSAVLDTAKASVRIDEGLYQKHIHRVSRMANRYCGKAAEERHENIMAAARATADRAVLSTIMHASMDDLDNLQLLIRKRRRDLQK